MWKQMLSARDTVWGELVFYSQASCPKERPKGFQLASACPQTGHHMVFTPRREERAPAAVNWGGAGSFFFQGCRLACLHWGTPPPHTPLVWGCSSVVGSLSRHRWGYQRGWEPRAVNCKQNCQNSLSCALPHSGPFPKSVSFGQSMWSHLQRQLFHSQYLISVIWSIEPGSWGQTQGDLSKLL